MFFVFNFLKYYNKTMKRSFTYLDKALIFCLMNFFLISSFCMAAYAPSSIFRHIILWAIGISIIVYTHHQNSDFLFKISKILFIISVFLIIFAYFKSGTIKGSRRWLSILGVSFQPSELLKSSSVIITSYYIYKSDYLKFALINLLNILLLVTQPDFGSILLLLTIMMIQLFLSDINLKSLFSLGLFLFVLAFLIILFLPHVKLRIINFFIGHKSILEGGYQGFTSIKTIKSGGLFGLGIGNGVVKQTLPDAYSDFIFAVIGEELGIIGCLYVIFLFLFMGYKSFYNNEKLQNYKKYYYLNISCISMFLIQSWINIASALWIIPTKGITLPFISHGGSSLLISFWTISALFISSKKAQLSRDINLEFD